MAAVRGILELKRAPKERRAVFSKADCKACARTSNNESHGEAVLQQARKLDAAPALPLKKLVESVMKLAAFCILRALSNVSKLLSERHAARFARSAAKRDPCSALLRAGTAPSRSVPLHRLKIDNLRREAKVLKIASWLVAPFSLRRSEKFAKLARRRDVRVASLVEPTPGVAPTRHQVDSLFFQYQPLSDSDDVLIFVLFSVDGKLSSLQRHQIASYSAAGYALVVVINTPCRAVAGVQIGTEPVFGHVAVIILRENTGFDFAGWAHALRTVAGLGKQRSISFVNDSILPLDVKGVMRVRERIKASQGVLFLTASREIRPHAQSYFFGFGRPQDARSALKILTDMISYETKQEVIQNIELHLSDQFARTGLPIEIAFRVAEAEANRENPTIKYWQNLLRADFPFIKIQLFMGGGVDPRDPRVAEILGCEVLGLLVDHLARRAAILDFPSHDCNQRGSAKTAV